MTKKLITIILILSLVMTSACFAFGSETEDNAQVAASNETAVQPGQTETNGMSAETVNGENQETGKDKDTEIIKNESTEKEDTSNTVQDQKSDEKTNTKTSKKNQSSQTKKETTKKKNTKTVSKYQKGLAAYIRSKNPKLSKNWSITLAGYFIKSGKKNNIDPKVLMALARRESNFNAKATSKYGHKGMMQCTSAFARSYGYKSADLYKAHISIEVAARYLRAMKNKHETYHKAIACYVCGSGAVEKGIHSREPGRSVMKVRNNIQKFLKKNNYV